MTESHTYWGKSHAFFLMRYHSVETADLERFGIITHTHTHTYT